MRKKSLLSVIKELSRPVFTTHEIVSVSGRSRSAVTQGLNFLQKEGFIFKIYRGVWAEAGRESISPYSAIPFLFQTQRAYVSFISALHLWGIIEQIPQVITLASTSHTKIIKTTIGSFSVHRISPSFFDGFDWYKDTGTFLVAQPEKALVDCLYLSAHKKRQFGYFPELHFSRQFSFKKAEAWAHKIPNPKVRIYTQNKLKTLKKYSKVQL